MGGATLRPPERPDESSGPGPPIGAGDAEAGAEGPAERDRVVEGGGDLPHCGVRVAGHPELAERRGKVEVDPLTHHLVALEREHDEHGKVHPTSGRRQPPPRALVGAPERALHHDHVIGVVQVGEVIVEVGEGCHVLLHEPAEWAGTVEYLAGGHELVARPCENAIASSNRWAFSARICPRQISSRRFRRSSSTATRRR